MTAPDFDLLDRVLHHIDGNPEWKQGSYRCDSGMCFAGWTVALAGGQWVSDDINSIEYHDVVSVGARGWGPEHVHDWARMKLGLTVEEAEELFGGFNKLDTIVELIETLRAKYADAVKPELIDA